MKDFHFIYTPRTGSKILGKLFPFSTVPVLQLANQSYLLPRWGITKLSFSTADPDTYWRGDAREVGEALTELGIPAFDECGHLTVFSWKEDADKIYDLLQQLSPAGRKSLRGEDILNRLRAGKEIGWTRKPFIYNSRNGFLHYEGRVQFAPKGAKLCALPQVSPAKEAVLDAFKYVQPLPAPRENHSESFKQIIASLGPDAGIGELEKSIEWAAWEDEILGLLMLGE